MKLNELIEHEHPSDITRAEIARLHAAGFNLIPLGGEDGKRPAIAGWKGKRLNLSQIFGPMYAQSSSTYGICLPGHVVLDCDENNPALVDQLEDRFGTAAVKIQTARGVHLYYEKGDAHPSLRSKGLPVDVKTGPASYVVGPHAQRPDGTIYRPLEGVLGQTPLTRLEGAGKPLAALPDPALVPEGSRHDHLLRKGLEMVAYVNSPPELEANLAWERDGNCQMPDTVTDAELKRIVNWCWNKRLTNSLYAGRDSAFRLSRVSLDLLRGFKNASDARALYADLIDWHGHTPGKVFSLNHAAMRKANRSDLSRRRFLEARRALEAAGCLKKVRPHAPGRRGAGYQLAMPRKGQRGGSILTLEDRKRSRPTATLRQRHAGE